MDKGVSFLTDRENEILKNLKHAMTQFEILCAEEPQNPTDAFNFGHYIDAAMNAVILRGARRIDPDHLLHPSKTDNAMQVNDLVGKLLQDHQMKHGNGEAE